MLRYGKDKSASPILCSAIIYERSSMQIIIYNFAMYQIEQLPGSQIFHQASTPSQRCSTVS